MSGLRIKQLFSFPPKSQEDVKIMKYIEFLEIKVHDDPGSPEISYSVEIDPKTIRCIPEFLRFIEECGSFETINGSLKDIFKYSHEETTDLLFFATGSCHFLIDQEGYLHLGTICQEATSEKLRFIVMMLKDALGFKIYEEERSGI
jgi:hypothetical protein